MTELVLCLALALGAAACDRSDKTAAPDVSARPSADRPHVTGIQLGTRITSDGRIAPGAEKTTFSPSDTIYTVVLTDHPPEGATISARWTYQDGQVVSEQRETLTSADRTVTEFHIAKPDGFPPGRYKVQIAMNGQLADEHAFEVR